MLLQRSRDYLNGGADERIAVETMADDRRSPPQWFSL
jgi:hypothetical protein